jgi:hypothetical protein
LLAWLAVLLRLWLAALIAAARGSHNVAAIA